MASASDASSRKSPTSAMPLLSSWRDQLESTHASVSALAETLATASDELLIVMTAMLLAELETRTRSKEVHR